MKRAFHWLVGAALISGAQPALGVTRYVDVNSAIPLPPYTNWVGAATSIQAAIDVATAGDTVLVADGVYDTGGVVIHGSMSNRIAITKAVTVRSVNGPEDTLIVGQGPLGDSAIRCAYVGENARLEGFTLTNGHTRTSDYFEIELSGGGAWCEPTAVVSNCTITGNAVDLHAGGGTYRGTIQDCTVTGNSAGYGGGTSGGTVLNCTIVGNSASFYGGGTSGGTVRNCIITRNTAVYGGGTYEGRIQNCTITRNSADGGGGTCWGRVENCIVYYNSDRTGSANCGPGTVMHTCTTPDPGGEGNITNPPMLLNASHIHLASPCVGAGSGTHASGADIDGDPWGSPPSMGCDEPAAPFAGELTVSISAPQTTVEAGTDLPLWAGISGQVSSNLWTFGDGASLSNTVYAQHAWALAESYDVILTAWNDDHPGGVSATVQVRVFQNDLYVDAECASPQPPYASWATAATTIQDAVDLAPYGSDDNVTVWVTNGVYDTGGGVTPGYACMNRVVITNDITVRSVNGPDFTFIVGAADPGGDERGHGSNAVRGVYMSAGVLSGFTVTNGHTTAAASQDHRHDLFNRFGGGVNMVGGSGVVSNCVLTGNSAYSGGGSCYGMLNNCTIAGNTVYSSGGGSYYSTLNDCTLVGNSAYSGGASRWGVLKNCVLTGNSAYIGGGSHQDSLSNCTLIGNAADYGGGSSLGTLRSCIVWGNTARLSGNDWRDGDLSYCCTTPLPGGMGNVTNAPLFVDAAASDYHLLGTSPCIDAGNNAAWMVGATDLNGHPRVVGGTVDMGAYEYVHSAIDYDGDGLSNEDETDVLGTDPTLADTDGDAASDYEEYLADTDALNSNEYFRIVAFDGKTMWYESSSNRVYSLEWCLDPVGGRWGIEPSQAHVPGSGGLDSLTDPYDDPSCLYRVEVDLP